MSKIFVRSRFQGSFHCSTLKFSVGISVCDYNRNILEMYPKYTDVLVLISQGMHCFMKIPKVRTFVYGGHISSWFTFLHDQYVIDVLDLFQHADVLKMSGSKSSYRSYLRDHTKVKEDLKTSDDKISYRSYLRDHSRIKIPRTTEWRWKSRYPSTETALTETMQDLSGEGCEQGSQSSSNESFQNTCTQFKQPEQGSDSQLDFEAQATIELQGISMEGSVNHSKEDRNIIDTLYNQVDQRAFEENHSHSDENVSDTNSDNSVSDDDWEMESDSVRATDMDTADRELLYPNAELTVSDCLMLLMTFSVRHSLSCVGFNDLLQVLDACCPHPNNIRTSVRQVWRYFENHDSEKVVHFYCQHCFKYLHPLHPPNENDLCSGCGQPLSENGPYFIQVPFQRQIVQLFQKKGFSDMLRHRFTRQNSSNIEDVYDGSLYKKLYEDGGFLSCPHNISLQMNTDGVSIFNSSKVSVWPLYLTINELPPKVRFSRDMRIFAGLWYGSCKPNFTTFLRPFAEELFDSYTNGISVKLGETEVTVRVLLLSACLDAPARCMFQGFTQFNGEYGCGYCLEKGKVVASGKGHARIYPFNHEHPSKLGHDDIRTHSETKKNAVLANQKKNATGSKKTVQGVQEISWALVFPQFDIILGVPVDYMHAVLLGVVKMLNSLWFTTAYSKYPWSCSKKIKECDSRRCAIAPPDFVRRIPRSLEEFCTKYKASEYRTWLLYYLFPVMKGILPPVYLDHALLLINGIYLLLKSSITEEDLEHSARLLQHFCLRMPSLYLLNKNTYNVHQLLHLPNCVRTLGPLWSISCFFYEDLNGDLRNLFHGSQAFDMQITTATFWLQQVSKFEDSLESGIVLRAYRRMTNIRGDGPRPRVEVSQDVLYFGRPVRSTLVSQPELEAIFAHTGSVVRDIDKFFRFSVCKVLYHSSEYKRVCRRNSFTVLLSENEGNAVAFVQYAFSHTKFCGHAECSVSKKCKDNAPKGYYIMVWVCEEMPSLQPSSKNLAGPCATMDYVRAVKPAKSVHSCKVVKPGDICEKLVYVEVNNNEAYVFRPPNQIEKE